MNTDHGKIRARLDDGIIAVKVLIRHPMETGSRKHPSTDEIIPRHYIREVVCEHNGKPVLTMDWGWAFPPIHTSASASERAPPATASPCAGPTTRSRAHRWRPASPEAICAAFRTSRLVLTPAFCVGPAHA
jgi:hypothetical protein